MPDSKITALASIGTGADPANDPLVIVDVSDTSMAASGTTKKITINQILGASGTATLASATITGNLTVDTNTLFVDSVNNRVGILTTSPAYAFDVAGLGNFTQLRVSATSATSLSLVNTTSGLTYTLYSANTASNGFNGFGILDGTSYVLRINTNGALVLTGGTVAASGVGIAFPATQVASSDANTLDDYEEGTWTGTLTGSTTNPTTPVTATGRYTKIGRQVSIQIHFSNVDTTGASGQIKVTGSPFSSNSSVGSTGSIMMSSIGSFTGSPVAFIGTSTTEIELYASSSAGAIGFVNHNAGASRSLWINLTYTV